jgi:hypothetical protein
MCVFGGGGCKRTSACMSACSCMCVCVCACLCELVYHSLPMRATVVGHPLIPSLSCTHTHTHELSLSLHTHTCSLAPDRIAHCSLHASLFHSHTHIQKLSLPLSHPPLPHPLLPHPPPLSLSQDQCGFNGALFGRSGPRGIFAAPPPSPSLLPPPTSTHELPPLLPEEILPAPKTKSHKTVPSYICPRIFAL